MTSISSQLDHLWQGQSKKGSKEFAEGNVGRDGSCRRRAFNPLKASASRWDMGICMVTEPCCAESCRSQHLCPNLWSRPAEQLGFACVMMHCTMMKMRVWGTGESVASEVVEVSIGHRRPRTMAAPLAVCHNRSAGRCAARDEHETRVPKSLLRDGPSSNCGVDFCITL